MTRYSEAEGFAMQMEQEALDREENAERSAENYARQQAMDEIKFIQSVRAAAFKEVVPHLDAIESVALEAVVYVGAANYDERQQEAKERVIVAVGKLRSSLEEGRLPEEKPRTALRYGAIREPINNQDRVYPCEDCGKLLSQDEGGTTFTVCETCWDKKDMKP